MLSKEEFGVVVQKVADDEVTQVEKNIDFDQVQSVINKYQTDSNDNVTAISFDLSLNGGNITYYQDATVVPKFGENYVSVETDNTSVILIEPLSYSGKEVQPFNRQSVFYLPYRFTALGEPTTEGNYRVYHNKMEGGSHYCDFTTPRHNELLKIITGKVKVPNEDYKDFINELLSSLDYEIQI